MRKAGVYRNSLFVGILAEEDDMSFTFEYDVDYFNNDKYPAVSLTMPKIQRTYKSPHLFPFFYNMLSEGENLQLQLRLLQISEEDHFSLLVETSSINSIGAIRLEEIVDNG